MWRLRIDSILHDHPDWCYRRQALKNRAKDVLCRLLGISGKMQNLKQAYAECHESVYACYCNGKVILDVGCGIGNRMLDLACSWQGTCYGLDYSFEMVGRARDKVGPERVCVGNAAELPFPDKSVDVVIMDHLIHHLPPVVDEASVREARRVAKDVVIINDSFAPESGLLRYVALVYWKSLDGGYTYRTLPEWQAFLGKDNILEETWGGGPLRFCLFVVRAANEPTR